MWREYNNTSLNNAQEFLCLHLDNTHNRIVDVLEDKAGRCQVLGIRQEICPGKDRQKAYFRAATLTRLKKKTIHCSEVVRVYGITSLFPSYTPAGRQTVSSKVRRKKFRNIQLSPKNRTVVHTKQRGVMDGKSTEYEAS